MKGQNFTMWKGDDRVITIVIEDATHLTGYSAKWHLAVNAISPKLITKQSGSGIAFDGNKVLVTLNSAETKDSVTAIPEGVYYHELELIDGSAKKVIASSGNVEILKSLVGRP